MRPCLAMLLLLLLAAPASNLAWAVDWDLIRQQTVPQGPEAATPPRPDDAAVPSSPSAPSSSSAQSGADCLGAAAAALPGDAIILECASLQETAVPRSFALWLENPEKHAHDPGMAWTCPDYSRGSYYSGPTRVSLLDPLNGELLNTIEMYDPIQDADTFDIPYEIPDRSSDAGAFVYRVANPAGMDKVGKPVILDLADLNGDGLAHEFYLATTENCMLTMFAVFGLSRDASRLVQHEVDLRIFEQGEPTKDVFGWLDNWPLFDQKAQPEPGVYQWRVDLRGRGGCLDNYEVRWNDAREEFIGSLRAVECAE